MFLGKARIIIQYCHVKENVNELKINWSKYLTKNFPLLQLRTPHQSTARTDFCTNYYKNYFSTMLQA